MFYKVAPHNLEVLKYKCIVSSPPGTGWHKGMKGTVTLWLGTNTLCPLGMSEEGWGPVDQLHHY